MRSSSRPAGFVTLLTWIALGAFVIFVAVGSGAFAQNAEQLIEFLPFLAPMRDPFIVIAFAFALCVEGLLVITGVLVGYVHADRIFRPSALRLVDGLVAAAIVATLLVIVALFFIPGPPQLYLLVATGVPASATIVLALVDMRSLLRRAVAMHVELEEVV